MAGKTLLKEPQLINAFNDNNNMIMAHTLAF